MSLTATIIERKPQRVLTYGRTCKSSDDCKAVWVDESGFDSRLENMQPSEDAEYYGICRCFTGATDGSFEYLAAVDASDDATVPEGMIELILPEGEYVQFDVKSLDEIGEAWAYTGKWFEENPQWKSYGDCNPTGCGCVDHPGFERYPANFDPETGSLYICVPLKKA